MLSNWIYAASMLTTTVAGMWAVQKLIGRRLFQMRDGIIITTLLFEIVLFSILGFKVPRWYDDRKIAPYKDHLPDYLRAWTEGVQARKLRAFAEMASSQKQAVTAQPIHGKVLTVAKSESGTLDVDFLFTRLPSDLRPNDPREVRTIAVMDCKWVAVGHYGAGASDLDLAKQHQCVVDLVDMDTRQILGNEMIQGSFPPAVTNGSTGASGSPADDEILKYLTKLPR